MKPAARRRSPNSPGRRPLDRRSALSRRCLAPAPARAALPGPVLADRRSPAGPAARRNRALTRTPTVQPRPAPASEASVCAQPRPCRYSSWSHRKNNRDTADASFACVTALTCYRRPAAGRSAAYQPGANTRGASAETESHARIGVAPILWHTAALMSSLLKKR
jgi:hypothetical protein